MSGPCFLACLYTSREESCGCHVQTSCNPAESFGYTQGALVGDRIEVFSKMPPVAQGLGTPVLHSKYADDGDGGVDRDDGLVWFMLMASSFFIMVIIPSVAGMIYRCCHNIGDEYLEESEETDLMYNDEEETEHDTEALRVLSPDEQEIYFQAKEFIKLNSFAKMKLAAWQLDLIKEKGVHAWEFLSNSDNHHQITIDNKTEITFNNRNTPLSIQSNLPFPDTKDVHYIEFKIFDIPEHYKNNTLISLGLSTFPYPSFVLPGRYLHSVAYDSTGDRRHNSPFPLKEAKSGYQIFPALEKGDVIGIGLKKFTRAVFFTRNGKKLSESKFKGHIHLPKTVQLFPTIGSINPCRIDVNFGQMGFVFIEANVKKWALAPLRGTEIPPPLYTKFNHDVLLDYSDAEDSELPEFEDILQNGLTRQAEFTDDERGNDELTLETIEHMPPNYDSMIQDEIREAMDENIEDSSPRAF